MISEVVKGPSPSVQERSWRSGWRTVRDQTLAFPGGMSMVAGSGFSLGDAGRRRSVPVAKRFETTADNRRLIVERTAFSAIENQILRLPRFFGPTNTPAATNASLLRLNRRSAFASLPPPLRLSAKGASSRKLLFSEDSRAPSPPKAPPPAALAQRSGFVLDWNMVGGEDGDFECGLTYLVQGEVHLSSAFFEPGVVVKYDTGYDPPSSLYVDGPLTTCNYIYCGSYPDILTSVNDDSYGDTMDWSTSIPQSGDYGPALAVWPEYYDLAVSRLADQYGDPGIIAFNLLPNGVHRCH